MTKQFTVFGKKLTTLITLRQIQNLKKQTITNTMSDYTMVVINILSALLPVLRSSVGSVSRGAAISVVSVCGEVGLEIRAISTFSGAGADINMLPVSETLSDFLSQSDIEPCGAGRTT